MHVGASVVPAGTCLLLGSEALILLPKEEERQPIIETDRALVCLSQVETEGRRRGRNYCRRSSVVIFSKRERVATGVRVSLSHITMVTVCTEI